MHPSSRILQAVAAAASTSTRTSRSTRILAHLRGAGHDLVGPPDPVTNLRPVYYQPRFTEVRPVSSTIKLHPYSLEEFGSSSSSGGSGGLVNVDRKQQARALQRLEKLRTRFEAEDLEWRLQRRRLDQVAHEYWSRSNKAFARAKAEAETRAEYDSLSPSSSSSSLSPSSVAPTSNDPKVMEAFLSNWVDSRSNEFERFQQDWLKGITGHIRPAIKAVYRDLRWKLELWRCGLL